MCDELEPKDYSKINRFSLKFKKVIAAINELVNNSLSQMMINSIEKFLKLLRFFCLRFNYCQEIYDELEPGETVRKNRKQKLDDLLSETVFKMKYKAMSEFHQVPWYIESATRRQHLFNQNLEFGYYFQGEMGRRIQMIELLIKEIGRKIHAHEFRRENLKAAFSNGGQVISEIRSKLNLNE